MSVFVRFHLWEPKNSILTFAAMVMGLFTIMTASRYCTVLRGSVLFEPCCHDTVEFLMLSPMCDHLVGVGAVIVALEAVEVTATLLVCTCNKVQWVFNVKRTRGTIPSPLPPSHFIFTTCLPLIAINVYEERNPCQNKDFGEM